MPATLKITFTTVAKPLVIYFPGVSSGSSSHRFDYIELALGGGSRRVTVGNDNQFSFAPGDGTNLFTHIELLGPGGYVRIVAAAPVGFDFLPPLGTNQRPYIDLKRPDGTYVRVSLDAVNQWIFTVL